MDAPINELKNEGTFAVQAVRISDSARSPSTARPLPHSGFRIAENATPRIGSSLFLGFTVSNFGVPYVLACSLARVHSCSAFNCWSRGLVPSSERTDAPPPQRSDVRHIPLKISVRIVKSAPLTHHLVAGNDRFQTSSPTQLKEIRFLARSLPTSRK